MTKHKTKREKPVKFTEKRATIVVILIIIIGICGGMLSYSLMSPTPPEWFSLFMACGLSCSIGGYLSLKEIKAWRVYENK